MPYLLPCVGLQPPPHTTGPCPICAAVCRRFPIPEQVSAPRTIIWVTPSTPGRVHFSPLFHTLIGRPFAPPSSLTHTCRLPFCHTLPPTTRGCRFVPWWAATLKAHGHVVLLPLLPPLTAGGDALLKEPRRHRPAALGTHLSGEQTQGALHHL